MTQSGTPASEAGTWQLGDHVVNRLGFGAMRLTEPAPFSGGPSHDRDQAIRVVRRAVELGVNHIDTAAFYFSPRRSANELLNTALSPRRDDVVITTKVGPSRGPTGEWGEWPTPAGVRGQVEENLRQLGRDHLDVVNLRRQQDQPIGELFFALSEMRTEGLISNLGLSAVGVEELAEARSIAPVVCVQNRYSLDVREAETEAVLEACGAAGIAFVPFFAITGTSARLRPSATDADAVTAIARAHGATPAQVRLAWTLRRGAHVLAIPGTCNLEHLEENVAAGALRLDDDEFERLSAMPDSTA